ncbi:MAG: gfo/Idh/MocA family oxidoreductase, partial [Geminicoccaceae bacterium]|nr:gfo/Idh/MocA family oxidoreductase [Geminicoccaceae bacterium]
HPEGYLEGFATIYSDAAELIHAALERRQPDAGALLVPDVRAGVDGVRFIEAVVKSSSEGGVWVEP